MPECLANQEKLWPEYLAVFKFQGKIKIWNVFLSPPSSRTHKIASCHFERDFFAGGICFCCQIILVFYVLISYFFMFCRLSTCWDTRKQNKTLPCWNILKFKYKNEKYLICNGDIHVLSQFSFKSKLSEQKFTTKFYSYANYCLQW